MKMYDDVTYISLGRSIKCRFVKLDAPHRSIVEILDKEYNGWKRNNVIPPEYKDISDKFYCVPTERLVLNKQTFTDPYKQELYDAITELQRANTEIRRDIL